MNEPRIPMAQMGIDLDGNFRLWPTTRNNADRLHQYAAEGHSYREALDIGVLDYKDDRVLAVNLDAPLLVPYHSAHSL